MIEPQHIADLKRRGMLDENGCPTLAAYKTAVNTVSSDFCPLCEALWNHSTTCSVCKERAEAATREAERPT